jgi:hypothetical protein
MNEVTCQTSKILDTETTSFTVGERFQLLCESKSNWVSESLTLEVPEELKYHIHPLRIEKLSDTKADLAVVSFLVGDHRLSNLKLDGKLISPIELKVSSVQDPKSPVKEPFGPILVEVSLPPLFPIALILGFILLILSFFLLPWLKKNRYQKKMALFYLKCRSELSPTEEFFRSIREINKNPVMWNEKEMRKPSQEVKELYSKFVLSLQILIGRTFEWPMTEHSKKEQDDFVNTIGQIDHELAKELLKLWFEIGRNQTTSLTGKDLSYMVDWSLKLAPSLAVLKRLNG